MEDSMGGYKGKTPATGLGALGDQKGSLLVDTDWGTGLPRPSRGIVREFGGLSVAFLSASFLSKPSLQGSFLKQ
jgi:hypothetical protein